MALYYKVENSTNNVTMKAVPVSWRFVPLPEQPRYLIIPDYRFNAWDDPREDIYTFDDGEEIDEKGGA